MAAQPTNPVEPDKFCRGMQKPPQERCANLVGSFPKIVEAVIAAKGSATRFLVKDLNT